MVVVALVVAVEVSTAVWSLYEVVARGVVAAGAQGPGRTVEIGLVVAGVRDAVAGIQAEVAGIQVEVAGIQIVVAGIRVEAAGMQVGVADVLAAPAAVAAARVV